MNDQMRNQTDEGAILTDEGGILTRKISVRRTFLTYVRGVDGSNVRRLKRLEDIVDVIEDWDRSVVTVKALTTSALEIVENDICSMVARLDLLKKLYSDQRKTLGLRIVDEENDKQYQFLSSHYCPFEVTKFCSFYGIDPLFVQEGNFISLKHIGKEKWGRILDFMNYWNTNFGFLDLEEIWQRKMPLILSNFTQTLLVSCNFIRNRYYYTKINTIRCMPGVQYVRIDCKETDVVLQITIAAKSKSTMKSAALFAERIFFGYLDSVNGLYLQKNRIKSSPFFFCIPYPCAAEKLFKNEFISMGKFPFLDKIYADPEVTSIELNEIEQTLTLYCSSQEKLDRLLFEVRGHMSLHKAFTWRKKYHAYFSYHIRINENEKKMDATFKKVSGYHKHVADFTDVVEDPGSLQYISLSRPQGDHDGVFQATTISHTHCLYSLSSMTTAVLRLLQFADFPILQNVAAYTKIGFTLYKLTRTKKYGQVQKPRTVVDFFNHWETNYYGQFSFDLNYSFMNDFVKLFRTEEFIETCRHDFIEVFFNDLGTNFRYMARIDGTQPPLNQHVVEYRQCKMHHCHFRLIELGGFKSCKEIILSSQRSCCNSQAKDFVQESIKSGELLEENVMSMNSYYSMYNVSIVNRIIFKYRNFIIHLDCVKKKSNQRYGKFSNVVHLTLHYPELNESLKTLQSDINDILLRNSIIDMYKELVSTSEYISSLVDQSFGLSKV